MDRVKGPKQLTAPIGLPPPGIGLMVDQASPRPNAEGGQQMASFRMLSEAAGQAAGQDEAAE